MLFLQDKDFYKIKRVYVYTCLTLYQAVELKVIRIDTKIVLTLENIKDWRISENIRDLLQNVQLKKNSQKNQIYCFK